MTLTCILAAGCLGEAADDDLEPGPIGGTLIDPTGCDTVFGRTFIIDEMRLMREDEGMDQDGDDEPDNALAFLRDLANIGWTQSIAGGSAIYLFDVSPSAQTVDQLPAEPVVTFYDGIDTDADPGNNVSGSARFHVSAEQFDVNCEPTASRFVDAAMEDGVLVASSAHWAFFMDGVGTIEFDNVRAAMWLEPDMSGFYGILSGTWSLCSLARTPFPGVETGNFLDRIVNGFTVAPDIDRDGDGLERVIGNGETVQSCVDGDGTEILDPFCACDPRIADGYSAAIDGTAVPAEIVGVVDTAP